MTNPDFNLLAVLDAVLTEGSVTRAAKRLKLSASAMSRALARLRAATGDPLLVRAGRSLVPTPRAVALRERVSQLVQETQAVLGPAAQLDISQLARTFTLRTREGFVENFGSQLIARAAQEAPGVRLCFLQKLDKNSELLRSGAVDLETGVVADTMGPEVRTQALFRDRFVGVVRAGHDLTHGALSASRYVGGRHIGVSLGGHGPGPVEEALGLLGLTRQTQTIVSGFQSALALARQSDLIATVPERHTGTLRAGMHTFALPFALSEFTVSMLWHPRQHADPAHRWLRQLVLDSCAQLR